MSISPLYTKLFICLLFMERYLCYRRNFYICTIYETLVIFETFGIPSFAICQTFDISVIYKIEHISLSSGTFGKYILSIYKNFNISILLYSQHSISLLYMKLPIILPYMKLSRILPYTKLPISLLHRKSVDISAIYKIVIYLLYAKLSIYLLYTKLPISLLHMKF